MSDIDLTQAVEAAARRFAVDVTRPAWDDLPATARMNMQKAMEPLITAALPHIERQVREQVAREIEVRLPAVLIATARDEDGWASDMQDAQLRLVDDGEWVGFCGQGSIDVLHISEYAARIARGERA